MKTMYFSETIAARALKVNMQTTNLVDKAFRYKDMKIINMMLIT